MRNFNLMSLRLLVLLAVIAIGLPLSAQRVALVQG